VRRASNRARTLSSSSARSTLWPAAAAVRHHDDGYVSWKAIAKGKDLKGRPPHFFDFAAIHFHQFGHNFVSIFTSESATVPFFFES
jgi:hypothetical protein